MDGINGCEPDGTDDFGGDLPKPEPVDSFIIGGGLAPSDQPPDFSLNGKEPTGPDLNKAIENSSVPDLVTENGINILVTKDTAQGIWEPSPMGKMIGEIEDIEHWHMQEQPDTCAIVSQEYILESYLDRDFTETGLVNLSIEKGYYSPGSGTSPWDVGKLLEDYNIPVERTAYRSFDDIIEKLENNKKIIVGVDANEIWENSDEQQLLDLFFMPQANHAVQVIGFDSDQEKVILNDSGHPDGKGMRVSLSDFSNAWEDSNNFMVYTKHPAPEPTTSIA